MATAYIANEHTAIEDVLQLYIEGVSKGDTGKLQKAFHGDAWMFGSLAGTRYDVPHQSVDRHRHQPPFDSEGSYKDRRAVIFPFETAAGTRHVHT